MTQSTREESFDSDRPAAQRLLSRPRIHPLSAEQLRHLLAIAQGDPMHLFFLVSGTTGMRISEVLALKWRDLDLNQQTLSVCRALLFPSPQSFLEAKPQRAQDLRTIHLTPDVVAALKHHLAFQHDLRVQAGGAFQDHGFVFCTGSGIPLQSSKVAIAYNTFLQKDGISQRI